MVLNLATWRLDIHPRMFGEHREATKSSVLRPLLLFISTGKQRFLRKISRKMFEQKFESSSKKVPIFNYISKVFWQL